MVGGLERIGVVQMWSNTQRHWHQSGFVGRSARSIYVADFTIVPEIEVLSVRNIRGG